MMPSSEMPVFAWSSPGALVTLIAPPIWSETVDPLSCPCIQVVRSLTVLESVTVKLAVCAWPPCVELSVIEEPTA